MWNVYRYSRAALPAPFVYDIPAQTVRGQVLWGETVYFRDLANSDYERMWPYYLITRERVIKLACLFDVFGLPDCTAELLQTRRSLVGDSCDALLDVLAAPGASTPGAYATYIRAFEADPQTLFPSRLQSVGVTEAPVRQEKEPEPPREEPQAPQEAAQVGEPASGAAAPAPQIGDTSASASELKSLRARTARLKQKTLDLRDRVRRRDEKIQQLTKKIAASDRRENTK